MAPRRQRILSAMNERRRQTRKIARDHRIEADRARKSLSVSRPVSTPQPAQTEGS